jgi:beta-glucosidase
VPGETRTVHVAVHPSRLAFYDPAMRFVTEPGTFTVSVGASAVDVRAQATIEIAGPEAAHRQRAIVPTVVRVE